MQDVEQAIEAFLNGSPFAVAGASSNREKFGNRVLRRYQQSGLEVYPINRREPEVEGLTAYPDLASLPGPVHGLSIVTPPPVTEKLVEQAATRGIRHVWMQPGAESDAAIERARELDLNVIAGGPCLLVELRQRES